MKFPLRVRHRRAVVVIYGRTVSYPRYRLAYRVNGQRIIKHFAEFRDAQAAAQRVVRELSAASPAPALSASQARDALAALERLETLRQATGRRVSLLAAVSEYAEATERLGGHSLIDAAERYARTLAAVTRRNLAEAVEEFIAAAALRTQAADGQRAQLSAKYAYNRAIVLRRFAAAFPNTALCDLQREHVDAFFQALANFSPKSRNHHRAALRQFFDWAARRDYLPATHRLGEAEGLRPERADAGNIAFYTPHEFRALLETADATLRPLVALGGLAGLRTAELLRLEWPDVWRVPGHVEISRAKSKTRQRRLVEIVPALAAWLAPYQSLTSGKLWAGHEIRFQEAIRKLCAQAGVTRKANGLRHAFVTYHFALHGNENLTAAQAGHAPAMIHAHYKGLATRAEAEAWFAVAPVSSADVIPLPALPRPAGH